MWWLVYTICIAVEPDRVECRREIAYPRAAHYECRKLTAPMTAYLEETAAALDVKAVYIGVNCRTGGDL